MSVLTRDPIATFDAPLYTGLLSNLGILLWITTGGICIFSYFVLSKQLHKISIFLLYTGILTVFLTFDDLFQLHEIVFPQYFHIPQKGVFIGYALMMILYLVYFKKIILETDYLVFGAAIMFFNFSIVFDQIPSNIFTNHHLFEDGFKLLGIVSWFIYFTKLCVANLKQAIAFHEIS